MAEPFLSASSTSAKSFGQRHRGAGLQPRRRRRRVRLVPRAVGLRQDDGAAHGRRLRGADLRHDRHRRQGRHAAEAQPAQHRHGVPGLCAVPEPDRRAEHRLRPEGRRHAEGRDRQARRRDARAHQAAAVSATAIPTSSPAASSSAWRSPARWRRSRSCCCSTSRCRRSTPRCACRCARKSARSRRSSASPPIFVTHDQEEALSISDRIVVMYGGKAEQVGTPFEIYNRPATQVRRQFRRHAQRARRHGHRRRGGQGAASTPRRSRSRASSTARRPATRCRWRCGRRRSRSAASPATTPACRGEIADVHFLGSVIRVRVGVGNSTVSLDTFNNSATPPPAVGEKAEISFSSERHAGAALRAAG